MNDHNTRSPHFSSLSTILVLALCLPACANETSVESTTQHVNSENALSFNRLSMNRLSMNRLSMNRLSMNRLSMNRLSMNSLDSEGIENDANGRELLRYVARCALNPNDVLVVDAPGGPYEYAGLLNLAPSWEHQALTASEERMVSACLVAHVNAFGVSVQLSMRAPNKLIATSTEMREFPVYEGSFFGQIFDGDSLKVYSCVGYGESFASAHSTDRALRACTDDSPACSIVSVGRCKDVCQTRTNRYGWQDCEAEGVVYPETVSVYLHDADTDGSNRVCPKNGSCYFTAGGGRGAILDCSESDVCDTDCTNDATCSVNAIDANDLFAWTSAATSETDCGNSDSCVGVCENGASCDVDCTTAKNCDFICRGGAECLLDCTAAGDCDFYSCEGGKLYCPNDVVVCGRSCPPASASVGTCGDGECAGTENSDVCPSDCGPPAALDSCGHPDAGCGNQAPAQCWCDVQCSYYGDCCDDYEEICD